MLTDSDPSMFSDPAATADPAATPAADQFAADVNALYQQYYHRDATPAEIESHRGNPLGIGQVERDLKSSITTDTSTPGPGGGGGVGGPGGGGGVGGPGGPSLVTPFNQPYIPQGSAASNPIPLPTPAPIVNQPLPTVQDSLAQVPGAPAFPTIPKFSAPTFEEAMNDPGYKFVVDQGHKQLENWAAARGTLNDSSTGKALEDYGQGAATTQYGNVWNRARDAYQLNTGTQYLDPYQAQYQTWQTGTVNPTMTQYGTQAGNVSQQNQTAAANVMQQNQTNAANRAHLNDVSWQDGWNNWLQNWNVFRDQRDSTFDKQFKVATA